MVSQFIPSAENAKDSKRRGVKMKPLKKFYSVLPDGDYERKDLLEASEVMKRGHLFRLYESPAELAKASDIMDHDGDAFLFALVETDDYCWNEDEMLFETQRYTIVDIFDVGLFCKLVCKAAGEMAAVKAEKEGELSGFKQEIVASEHWETFGCDGSLASQFTIGGANNVIAAEGFYPRICSATMEGKIFCSGTDAEIANGGLGSDIVTSAKNVKIANVAPEVRIEALGDYSVAVNTSIDTSVSVSGKASVAANLSFDGKVRGELGCWLVLAEYELVNKKQGYYKPVCVKSAEVDGKTILPDTWYKLENGEFVETTGETGRVSREDEEWNFDEPYEGYDGYD